MRPLGEQHPEGHGSPHVPPLLELRELLELLELLELPPGQLVTLVFPWESWVQVTELMLFRHVQIVVPVSSRER
jgi:hypothetical protein